MNTPPLPVMLWLFAFTLSLCFLSLDIVGEILDEYLPL